MSHHSGAAFNHSCLKVPVDPESKLPAPNYEQKYINQLKNQELRKNSAKMKEGKTSRNSRYKAFIEFYDSIPDYSDVNHLSNKEFYRKLEALKAKQKSYYELLETEREINFEDPDCSFLGTHKDDSRKRNTGRELPEIKKSSLRASPETDSLSSCKEIVIQPPSRRSVRIESPKSDHTTPTRDLADSRPTSFLSPKSSKEKSWKRNISSAESKFSESSKFGHSFIDSLVDDDDKDFCDDLLKNEEQELEEEFNKENIGTRSLPNSPVKKKNENKNVWNDCGITIPKPFKMTVRDEEDRIVEEILAKNEPKIKSKHQDLFRANDVPIESKIPLFDKIMEEKEIRSQIIKKRSKEALLSKMRPFSFTKREEEEQALTRRFSKSSPQLTFEDIPSLRVKPFKARPVPRNLFSNYIYAKMHEDEFYRALKRRIRAEELLRASSLPPSMEKRAKTKQIRPICPRALREMQREIDEQLIKQEMEANPTLAKMHCHNQDDSENSFITTAKPFKFQTDKLFQKRARSAKKCHRAKEYDTTENKRAQSALELQSVNRSNLAAVLRIQSASLNNVQSEPNIRKRMEDDIAKKLEEEKFQEELRWREKVMRQKPVWQDLSYTSEDDIAIRLQMRKEEDKLRQEEFRHHMDMMLGRVQQIPTLFERQSKYGFEVKNDGKNDKFTPE